MAGSRGCRRSGCAKRGRGTSETFLPSQVHTIGIKIAGERLIMGLLSWEDVEKRA